MWWIGHSVVTGEVASLYLWLYLGTWGLHSAWWTFRILPHWKRRMRVKNTFPAMMWDCFYFSSILWEHPHLVRILRQSCEEVQDIQEAKGVRYDDWHKFFCSLCRRYGPPEDQPWKQHPWTELDERGRISGEP